MSLTLDMSPTQSRILQSEAKHTGAFLGFGFGKTFTICVALIMDMIRNPTANYLWLSPTYILLRDIFYSTISEILTNIGLKYKINRQENIVYVQGHGHIYCRTMDRPEMIIGVSVFKIFMDELDVLPTDKALHVYKKASARLRQVIDGKKNQTYVASTPEGFKAGYQLFKKNPMQDSALIQGSTYENEHNLPPDYIDDLKSQYPDQLIQAYLHGEFVNLTSGTVYPTFDRKECDTHYVAKPKEPVHIGMDFNVYNMAAIVHVIREGVPYAVAELTNIRDTPAMIEAIREEYAGRSVMVYPDATGKNASSKGASLSDIGLLKGAGFIVKAKKSNPMVKDRVQSMNRAFENQAYFINTEKCPVLTESLEQQVYDKNGQPDKSTGLDHCLDAAGYFIHYNWPIVKPVARMAKIRGF